MDITPGLALLLSRCSDGDQSSQILQLIEMRAFCRKFELEASMEEVFTGSAWGSPWKAFLKDKIEKAAQAGVSTVILCTRSRFLRVKDFKGHRRGCYTPPSQEQVSRFFQEVVPENSTLTLLFVEDYTDVKEHALLTRLGNPGRPISRKTAKKLARGLRVEGMSYRKIQEELACKHYHISLRGLWKWINEVG